MMAARLTTPLLVAGTPDFDSDVRYLAGFNAADPIVCGTDDKICWLVVPSMERCRAERALQARPGIHVWTPDSLGLDGVERRSQAAWALAGLRRAGWRDVRVPESFPAGIVDTLRRRRIKVSIDPGPVLPRRLVKSPHEQRCIREAQRAAVIAMRAAIAMIGEAAIDAQGCLRHERALLTAERVQQRIGGVLLDHRCFCADTIVAGGKAAACPHERGSGPLPAHYPIVIDIFPRHLDHGYWGDITRTVVRGTPSAFHSRMYAAVRAAQRASLSKVRAGIQARTVHQAACDVFAKRQFKTQLSGPYPEGFIHGTGHGLGLAVHEEPRVAGNRDRLRAGQVITIEPGLYYPEHGGVRIEDTVVVTADGWRYLAPCEKRFEIGT